MKTTAAFILFVVVCLEAYSAVVLTPGSGFTGPTAVPAAIGSDAEIVIAHFDVVPYDEFADTFNVGVVAFHHQGMDRVEFSFQNGPWTAVKSMTYNPQTNVVEYWATLDASTVADGQVEVRAIAYPNSGLPRVMSVVLFANNKGSLPRVTVHVDSNNGDDSSQRDGLSVNTAWRSIPYAFTRLSAANTSDGAVIQLQRGQYGVNGGSAVNNARWITIEPASGVAKSEAVINQGSTASRFNVNRLRISTGVEVQASCQNSTKTLVLGVNSGTERQLWFSNTYIKGPGYKTIADNWINMVAAPYFTDVEILGTGVGVSGIAPILNGLIVRNVYAHDLSGDLFNGVTLLLNAKVRHHHQVGEDESYDACAQVNVTSGAQHPDVFQLRVLPVDNVIYYGMDLRNYTGQTLFFQDNVNHTVSNMAIVNCVFEPGNTAPFVSQLDIGFRHVIMTHTYLNQNFFFRTDAFATYSYAGTNLFKGNVFQSVTIVTTLLATTMSSLVKFEDNHFMYKQWLPEDNSTFTLGTDIALSLDKGPSDTSVLLGRVANPLVLFDVRNLPRTLPTTIGPLVPGVVTPLSDQSPIMEQPQSPGQVSLAHRVEHLIAATSFVMCILM